MVNYTNSYIRDNIINKINMAEAYILTQFMGIELICAIVLLRIFSNEMTDWTRVSLIILATLVIAVSVAIFSLLALWTLAKVEHRLEIDMEVSK